MKRTWSRSTTPIGHSSTTSGGRRTWGEATAPRGRRDVLLSVWLTAALGEEANVGHLYREARTKRISMTVRRQSRPSRNWTPSRRRTEPSTRSFRHPLGASPWRIEGSARSICTTVPLLTWLATLDDSQLSLADHVRTVLAIESWALRRAFVGWQTRGYGSLLARVLKDAKSALSEGRPIVDSVEGALQAGARGRPTMTCAERSEVDQFYNGMSQARIRLLLGSIDQQLRDEDPHEPDAIVEYDNLQIEHVMPRSWVSHWPLLADDATPALRMRRSRLRWSGAASAVSP